VHHRNYLYCAQTWITQFYLQITPCLPLLPSRRASLLFGWYSFYTVPRRVEGWVNLGGWLHTEIQCRLPQSNPDTVTHPSTNRTRRRLTSLLLSLLLLLLLLLLLSISMQRLKWRWSRPTRYHYAKPPQFNGYAGRQTHIGSDCSAWTTKVLSNYHARWMRALRLYTAQSAHTPHSEAMNSPTPWNRRRTGRRPSGTRKSIPSFRE